MEVGDTATEFEHRSVAEELSLCERYFEEIKVTAYFVTGNSYNTAQFNAAPMFFKTKKRSTPDITFPTIGTTSGTIGATNATANYVSQGSVLVCIQQKTGFKYIIILVMGILGLMMIVLCRYTLMGITQ